MSGASGMVRTRRLGDGVLSICIDRPAKRNGITPEMWEQMLQAYELLEKDADFRVGLLHAEGDHFTGGVDLPAWRELQMQGVLTATAKGRIDPLGLTSLPRSKPVVVAVEGVCYTVGIELMLASEVVVAAIDARFSQLEVKRGVIAYGGATVRMVQSAGWGNAMSVLLTGDEFGAEEALRFGFVQKVVPRGEAYAEALAIARRIAANAPLAVFATISNAHRALAEGPAAAVGQMAQLMADLVQSKDAAEGAAAFVEKRPGTFVGR